MPPSGKPSKNRASRADALACSSWGAGHLPRVLTIPFGQSRFTPEETTELAVLHSGRPDTPGHPVLDVLGVAKEHGLLRIPVVDVLFVVVRAIVGVVTRGGDGDVTHLL